MSFKIGRFFYLLVSFILGAFFLIFGLFSVALPWSALLRTGIVQFILEDQLFLPLFGLGFFLIGLSVLIYTFFSTRYRYITIRIGNRAVTVEEAVIQRYLETYWHEHLPNQHIPSAITIRKDSIQIVAHLPAMSKNDQETFLKQIQADFTDIFGRILGYPHEIYFIAKFQPETVLLT